jgi:hypothetical protein
MADKTNRINELKAYRRELMARRDAGEVGLYPEWLETSLELDALRGDLVVSGGGR